MRWLDYPFYRLLGFFIAGILCSRFLNLDDDMLLIGICVTTIICGIAVLFYQYYFKLAFTIASCLCLLGLGATIYEFKTDHLAVNHYDHLDIYNTDQILDFTLLDQLSSNNYNRRFYAQVHHVGKRALTGKILVLFKRDDSTRFKPGDRLAVYDDINKTSNARNPGEFNYRAYLESIDVYGQVYVDTDKILHHTNNQSSLPWYANLRNEVMAALNKSELSAQPRSMIEALVLGQRQNVDPRVSQSFRDAGVIHILALSGLHIGIILLILRFLTSWILRIPYGRWIQTIFIIFLLWCYALLTGMSPSIMRAVTMFSFVAIGLGMNRKASVFHSLTISAFVLLCIDPRLLFQVGFQLSYTAVLSIVLLQPLFASLLPKIKSYIGKFLWDVFTVTLSAQIGVALLSIFYFHQFPLSFLLGNMLLLPLLPIIIGASLLMVGLLFMGWEISWFTSSVNIAFQTLIDLVVSISSMENLIIRDLYMEPIEVVLGYAAIICAALFLRPQLLKSKRERYRLIKTNNMLHLCLVCLIMLTGFHTYKETQLTSTFLVLHQSRGTAVALGNQDRSQLYIHMPAMAIDRKKTSVKRLSNITDLRTTKREVDSLPALLDMRDRQLLTIDEHAAYTKESTIKNPIVLLSHSPKINLEKLISDLDPKLIISDGSNYRNVAARWKKTCVQKDIPFINTFEHGAVDLTKF
jgi:competence protein ComEC